MNDKRKIRAAFWCKRNLKRTLAEVVDAITVLLEAGEPYDLVRKGIKEGFPGMPIATLMDMAQIELMKRQMINVRDRDAYDIPGLRESILRGHN